MGEWAWIEPAPGVWLRVTVEDAGVRAIEFNAEGDGDGVRNPKNPLLVEAASQLTAYFDGRLTRFNLPLQMEGTPFQVRVWRALESIPYGETRSYAQIAAQIGAPRAMRAVGAANGANPLPIVVPCHRVIGGGGKLVGYGGGLPLKKRLLELEARVAGTPSLI
ncbi:MAG: methylated-DNA--[protein]-cysteine S-methyltransferase [Bryobacteraceae bacterium]